MKTIKTNNQSEKLRLAALLINGMATKNDFNNLVLLIKSTM